jgi:hypothetical protein
LLYVRIAVDRIGVVLLCGILKRGSMLGSHLGPKRASHWVPRVHAWVPYLPVELHRIMTHAVTLSTTRPHDHTTTTNCPHCHYKNTQHHHVATNVSYWIHPFESTSICYLLLSRSYGYDDSHSSRCVVCQYDHCRGNVRPHGTVEHCTRYKYD